MSNKAHPQKKRIIFMIAGLLLFVLAIGNVMPVRAEARRQATLSPTPTSTPSTCTSWNLAGDFRTSPNQENPNRDSCNNPGIWGFMGSGSLSRIPANYYLLPNFTANAGGYLGLDIYDTASQFPHIDLNSGTVIVLGAITLPANAIDVHPAPGEMGIIAWHSLVNGYISISGLVSDNSPACGDGILWYIDKNSTNVASGGYANGGSQTFASGTGGAGLNSLAVIAGDVIYLAIHPGGDYFCDDGLVDLTINVTSAPTPTSVPSVTPTITKTPTITLTPSRTLTATITYTPSRTPTITRTPTKTPTASRTPTASYTPWWYRSPTPSRTFTPTITFTPSKTSTPTITLTPSNIPTSTPTITFTPTLTPISTATLTPTNTPVPSWYTGNSQTGTYGVKANISIPGQQLNIVNVIWSGESNYVTTGSSETLWMQTGWHYYPYLNFFPLQYVEWNPPGDNNKQIVDYNAQGWGATSEYKVTWLSGEIWCASIDGDEKVCFDIGLSAPSIVNAHSEVHVTSQNELNTDFSNVFYLASNGQWLYFSQDMWLEDSPYLIDKIQYYLYRNHNP